MFYKDLLEKKSEHFLKKYSRTYKWWSTYFIPIDNSMKWYTIDYYR